LMRSSFSGPGAGRYQTASAVIYDLLQVEKNNPLEQCHSVKNDK